MIKTINNLSPSKLTFDSHNLNLQLKLPQVPTRINPPSNNVINNNTPHITNRNK